MRILNVAMALLLLLTIFHVVAAGRELKMKKKQQLRLEALNKGPVPPSGPSGCTYIPGSGASHCPAVNAGSTQRLVVPFGVATNQH
ncbi:hypothetical protein SESBI_42948 [Sesbania bispinosa]|nr:hypothetical protein SESBI_42948 [Sesbania bispinosa]